MSIPDRVPLPKIASAAEWQAAHQRFLAKEKEATRARDALAAERRQQPMTRVDKDYVFDGPQGSVTLLDLFQGRRQLLLYHFMFAPGVMGWPDAGCPGCSMFIDSVGQFATTHLNARDASFAVVSLGPLEKLLAYKNRLEWKHLWVSSAHNSFNVDFAVTTDKGENHGLSVFLQDDGKIYRTYFTSQRGLETVGTIWSLLDITPYGRQEQWENSPEGWPQTPPYQWWHRHDEY